MINIKNKISDKTAKKFLNNLVSDKIGKNGKILKNLINTIEKNRDTLSGQTSKYDDIFKEFLNYLISKINEVNLSDNLITMKPEQLNDFKVDLENKYGTILNSNYKTIKYKKKEIFKTYRKLLREIFYYDEYDRWDAYLLATDLNVNTCPYCNRIPTFTLGNSKDKGARPQFDHFFDKERFPYLSLSIYNLVPSCSICNSSYKGTKEFNITDHFHPYIKGFDCENIKFTLEVNNIEDILSVLDKSLKIPEYKIKFKCDPHKTLPNNINDLGLEELYNYDKSYTNDIIKKSLIYNKDYIESLYKEWEGTLFDSKDEIKNFVMGNYLNIEDINNRPLGKLTKDITEELGIF